ncbi:MAG: metallophosphoesterase [Candidatus Omnitrophota bacterium]
MRYAIFSDIHGNLEAFSSLIESLNETQIDKFIFIGDIIGYGADPCQCISMLKSMNPAAIAGNHDWAVTGRLSLDYFNSVARQALLWTKKQLGNEELKYLDTFTLVHDEDDFVCVHGSLREPEKFNYVWDIEDASYNFSLFQKKICFLGHSHKMAAYFIDERSKEARILLHKGEIQTYLSGFTIHLKENERYLINVGSVGQPRDEDPRLSMCIYDSQKKEIELRKLSYDIVKAAKKIIDNCLPSVLASRLFEGW